MLVYDVSQSQKCVAKSVNTFYDKTAHKKTLKCVHPRDKLTHSSQIQKNRDLFPTFIHSLIMLCNTGILLPGFTRVSRIWLKIMERTIWRFVYFYNKVIDISRIHILWWQLRSKLQINALTYKFHTVKALQISFSASDVTDYLPYC